VDREDVMINHVRVGTPSGYVDVAVEHTMGQYRIACTSELVHIVGVPELANLIARALRLAAGQDDIRVWPQQQDASTGEIPRVRKMPYSPEVKG